MFSCPSGMKVSSSRVPPPKVTTTAFCPLRIAIARKGENADSMVAAVAPAVARRNSRRLHEISRSMDSEYLSLFIPKELVCTRSCGRFAFLPPPCPTSHPTSVLGHTLLCRMIAQLASCFFRFRVLLFYLLEYRQVLSSQLLLVGACVQEKQTIVRAIVIGAKFKGLGELPDRILVLLLILIQDAELVVSLIKIRIRRDCLLQQSLDPGHIGRRFSLFALPQTHGVVVGGRAVIRVEMNKRFQAIAYLRFVCRR